MNSAHPNWPLACPDDHHKLTKEGALFHCHCCHRQFPLEEGIARLLPMEFEQPSSAESAELRRYAAGFSSRVDKPWRSTIQRVWNWLGEGYLYSWASRRIEEMSQGEPLVILDAACGAGVLQRYLPARHDYMGVDFSERMLRRATRNGSGKYMLGHLGHLPLLDFSVDVAVCLQALQYLDPPGIALSELSRVLRPGGKAIISVPNCGAFKYRRLGLDDSQVQKFDVGRLPALLAQDFEIRELEPRGVWIPFPRFPMHAPGVYGSNVGISWTAVGVRRQ
jgi:SAM-dependent methyltransferase